MARGTEPVKRGDSWTVVVDIGPDPVTGKRRRKRVTARTKREVEHSLRLPLSGAVPPPPDSSVRTRLLRDASPASSGSVHPIPAPLGTIMAPRPALSRRRGPEDAAPLPPSPR